MARNIKELVAQMTLEEKADMCSGEAFWNRSPLCGRNFEYFPEFMLTSAV